jgi:hypothetical protein
MYTELKKRLKILTYFLIYKWPWLHYLRSWDSVVVIGTGYGPDDRKFGVRIPIGSRILSSPLHPDQLWGPPASYKMGTGALSPGIKRLRREDGYSPPTIAEVKKMWIYSFTPPYAFMV